MKIFTVEYGTADNPEQFKFLYKYSPYHNVKKGIKYSAICLTIGEADTRADPSHALKITRILQ